MEYLPHIRLALAYLEDHLYEDVDNAALAAAAGYSAYHFLRVFRQVTGLTPASYLRKRRLSEAVRRLQQSNAPICDIAFACGFNSKESFTRAFRAEHHITPSRFRAANNSLKLLDAPGAEPPFLCPVVTLRMLPPVRLVVYPSDEDFTPNFWNRYNAEGWSQRLSGGRTVEDLGVFRKNPVTGRAEYYIGMREEDARGDVGGTVVLEIPGGLYAAAETPPVPQFHFVNTIHRTWDWLIASWLPRNGWRQAGGFELESYTEASRSFSETIFIPVEPTKGVQTMKKLTVSFEHVTDTTGYLFSFARCLNAALRCSGLNGSCGGLDTDFADDAVAASGFAFRMWAEPEGLCPSAFSTWEFSRQPEWMENAGLRCGYVQRLWDEEAVRVPRREQALALIRVSVDAGVPAICWDPGDCEWGLIIGYDDDIASLYALFSDGQERTFAYTSLGEMEIPILSVLTITEAVPVPEAQLVQNTKHLAAAHLHGQEWSETPAGLAVYEVVCAFIEKRTAAPCFELEYLLGTVAALKWYAWKFFARHEVPRLAALYHSIHENWQQAFTLTQCKGAPWTSDTESRLIAMLHTAEAQERKALRLLEA